MMRVLEIVVTARASLLVVLVALSSCAKGDTARECGASLTAAIKRAKAASAANLPPGERTDTDAAFDALQGTLVSGCKSQGWSAQAIGCVTTSKTDDDVKTCATRLTDAQKKSLVTDVASTLAMRAPSLPAFGGPPYSQAALDSLDDAVARLKDATTGLTDARLRTDPRTPSIEEAIVRARQRALLNEAEEPELPFRDSVRRARKLALRYRLERALPALILARDMSPAGP